MKQKKNKMVLWFSGFILLSVAFCCFLPGVLAGQGAAEEKIYYIVREGDTLWGISDRFYEDPLLWPFVWGNNPVIDNPHWIYPGDKVFLAEVRARLAKKPGVVREKVPRQEVAAAGGPQVETLVIPRKLADTALLSEEKMKAGGWVVDSMDGRTIMSQGDELFLEMAVEEPVREGQIFQVVRKIREVRHPKTRKKMGALYRMMGFVKTTEASGDGVVPARVILSNGEISVGDAITQGIQLPATSLYSKLSTREVDGTVVTNLNNRQGIVQFDVCFIDKGVMDGVEVGDSFSVLDPGKEVKGFGKERHVSIPDRKIGSLVVLFTGKNTSTALVTESDAPFYAGAPVKTLTK